MKTGMRIIPLLLVLLGVAASGACSKEKSIETPEGTVTVKEDKGGVEVKSTDGKLNIKGNENAGEIKVRTEEGDDLEVKYDKKSLVAGFPKEIPIYAPSQVTMSQILKDKNALATLSTKDDPAAVVTFYKNSMASNGWSMEGEMNMGGMTILQGKKGTDLLNVSVAKTEAETTITLALTEETGP